MSCTPQTYGGKTCYTKSTTACDSNQKCENGQCVSKCNTANNQYADERECDEDWHQWWKCYKNNSSGCWYPTCNEDDDYYTDQQTCEIETGKNCEVESATANYIVCYTPKPTPACTINVYLTIASDYGWNGFGEERIYVSTSQPTGVPITINWTATEKCWSYDYHSDYWDTTTRTESDTSSLSVGETEGSYSTHYFNDGTSAAGDEISGGHCVHI